MSVKIREKEGKMRKNAYLHIYDLLITICNYSLF
jgi:hypothetical protein